MRLSITMLLGALALAACHHDEQPIVVTPAPTAATPNNTVVVPAPAQKPVIVVPQN